MCLSAKSPPLHSQVVDLAVEAISPEGITLRSQGKEAAYLPVAHLSDHMELCQPLLLQHQTRLEAALAEGGQYIVRGLLVVCHKLPIRHAVSHTLRKSSISVQDKGTYVLMHKVLCTYICCMLQFCTDIVILSMHPTIQPCVTDCTKPCHTVQYKLYVAI